MTFDHDVLVLGGGSGGYAAARTARAAGADVAIADPGPLGGLCILRGCMPSKAILRSAAVAALLRRAAEFGLRPVDGVSADLGAIIDRKARLVQEFAAERIQQLQEFPLYREPARFLSPHQVQVGSGTLRARSYVIATGSVVRQVPVPGLEQVGYLTSDGALDRRQPPESLLVLGGGAVACELAQFYCRVGVPTTLLQRSHHLLSHGDEDLARPLEARFRQEGMRVFTGTRLHRFSRDGGLKTAHFRCGAQEQTAAAHDVLLALGRRPNTDGLGLGAAGVTVDQDRVCADDQMRTNQPHILAVGDVSGTRQIAHIAVLQGEVAGHNAAHPGGPWRRLDDRLKMEVVFTDPAVATVGLSERECQALGVPYLVASHPFADHGKAMCLGETCGLAKVLCDPRSGAVLGAGICGPEAGELIHEVAAVMHFRGTVRDLALLPHYHPTLAEVLTYPAEELAAGLGG